MPALSRHLGFLTALLLPFLLQAQTYFQQRVDYTIDVRLDDNTNDLFGTESFTYTNNAPQTLDTIWIHLWPNAYKDRSTALCHQLDQGGRFGLHFAEKEQRGWIDSLDFKAPEAHLHGMPKSLTWGYDPANIDIAWIKLHKPLGPGQQITISTPFHVHIPSARFSRLGHLGDAFYITQWYPKPAVFDNKGWHAMPYLGQGEFYSEFGSFDVSITLPANYVVGATGELQNAEEIAWMDSLSTVPFADDKDFYLRKQRSVLNVTPASSSTMKTLRFKQDNVHDFGWFADKRFIVRKGSVTLARSGRTVTTWALFTPENADIWKDGVTYVSESVRLYSEWIGDYPYSACTAIDGTSAEGGGMEYPMITIINESETEFDLDVVIAHEVGHNWFYGILASNERDHAWMDEGINSFYEQRYVETRYPGKLFLDLQGIPLGMMTRGKGITYRQQNELQYRFNARRNWDGAPENHATAFGELDYGTTVYSKTAVVFDQMRLDLGEPLFDKAMQRYFEDWHFKHPYPEDLRTLLERETAKDLSWYFDTLINTSRKVEVNRPAGTVDHSPIDIDPRNDHSGLHFPEVKFLAGLEREDRKSIYWSPAIGYNTHDSWMGGLALYNTVLPNQRFEWVAVPMYGFESQRLAGGARFMWNHDRLTSNWLRNIHLGVSGFAASLWSVGEVEQWYQRAVPSIQFDLRSRTGAPVWDLRYRAVSIWTHAKGTYTSGDFSFPVDDQDQNIFLEGRVHVERKNGLHPFDADLTLLNHDAFTRLSLTAKWSAIFDRSGHRISFRFFGGDFLNKDEAQMTSAMGWRLHWGSSDLLYDHLFIDRQYVGQNTARQFVKDQGGFKTPTRAGTSSSWITALNMEVDFPFRLPFCAFASYGASPYTIVSNEGKTTDWKGQWEAGIGIRIVRDVAEIWIPLAYSTDIQEELDNVREFSFTDRIRFVVALEKLDPTQALRKAPH